jgi:RNA polymerase sigma-70 factor (ECF subfamily)
MFCCCPEILPPPAQVALILRVLCGFSTGEIARALLLGEAAVEKQLVRGRHLLQRSGKLLEVSGVDKLRRRIEPVHRALYLLFSEGYHGSHPELAVRAELCGEALRLCRLLAMHASALPATHALHALICFGAARLPARLDGAGSLVLLDAQDRARWDRALIDEGFAALERSGEGEQLTRYHVEAGIAWAHCSAPSFETTPWARIVELYDLLLELEPSPVIELNRAIALGQLSGPDAGIAALQALAARGELSNYPFLEGALGVLQMRAGRPALAAEHLRAALARARNPLEAQVFAAKLSACAG